MSIIREKIYLSDLEIEVILDALDIMWNSDGQRHSYTEKQVEANTAAAVKIARELTRRREQIDGKDT